MYALEVNRMVSVYGSEVTIEEVNVHGAVSGRVIETLQPVNIVETIDLESAVFNDTVYAVR